MDDPSSRMLKKSTSFVLASAEAQRAETYGLTSSLAAAALGIRRVSARLGWAGETSGHFEHPVSRSCAITSRTVTVNFEHKLSFSVAV